MSITAVRGGVFRGSKELAEHVLVWVNLQDSPVSVRKVFYAMVSHYGLDNTDRNYRLISDVVTKLRRWGQMDWSRISDSTRSTYKTQSSENAETCVTDALESFRLDRWADQESHIEVWVEKRGHIDTLFPTTDALDVVIAECGGKRALSEEDVSSLRGAKEEGKKNVILYVGDYDPSGLRMDKNMREQLSEWGLFGLTWDRVALRKEHIDILKLPQAYVVPDTASRAWLAKHPGVEIIGKNKDGVPLVNKLEKDMNAAWFREHHNGELFQVEVDAMETDRLRELVQSGIERRLDRALYDEVIEKENEQREEMRRRLGLPE